MKVSSPVVVQMVQSCFGMLGKVNFFENLLFVIIMHTFNKGFLFYVFLFIFSFISLVLIRKLEPSSKLMTVLFGL